MYADTLDRAAPNVLQRVLGRPGSLMPHAAAKLARRERDDAYRAAARAQSAVTCTNCGGGHLDVPIVKFVRGKGLEMSRVGMAMATFGEGRRVHVDPRACAAFRGQKRRGWGARVASLFKRK